ncbi:MAG: hypothetical protein LBF58_04620 [Deltaproteobacteria bacterium]|jgi:hypothetical protein|nr:hypothetical protein [Deltaproteobacteria bacterium]
MSDERNKLFETIEAHKDGINWILEKQAELRAELLAFYKVDISEIESALSFLDDEDAPTEGFGKKAIETAYKTFIEQWLRSYNLITPASLTNTENE